LENNGEVEHAKNNQRTMIQRNFNRCDPVTYRKFLIVSGFVWGPVCLNVYCGESAAFSQLHQGYALTATCLPNHAQGTAESLQSTVLASMQALYLRFKTSFLFIKYHLSIIIPSYIHRKWEAIELENMLGSSQYTRPSSDAGSTAVFSTC